MMLVRVPGQQMKAEKLSRIAATYISTISDKSVMIQEPPPNLHTSFVEKKSSLSLASNGNRQIYTHTITIDLIRILKPVFQILIMNTS